MGENLYYWGIIMRLYNFLNEIYRILRTHTLTGEELRKRDEDISNMICKKLARGNISLINGRYMTSQYLENRRNANITHRFSQ